jgi:hypothetical protein
MLKKKSAKKVNIFNSRNYFALVSQFHKYIVLANLFRLANP